MQLSQMDSSHLYHHVIKPWFKSHPRNSADAVTFLFIWGGVGRDLGRSFLAQLCRNGQDKAYGGYKYNSKTGYLKEGLGGWMSIEDSDFICMGAEVTSPRGITFVMVKRSVFREMSPSNTCYSLIRNHKELAKDRTDYGTVRFTLD